MCMNKLINECVELKGSQVKQIEINHQVYTYHLVSNIARHIEYAKYIIFDLKGDKDYNDSILLYLADMSKFEYFQDKILEDEFFSTYSDLRFNLYLVFIVNNIKDIPIHNEIKENYKFAKKMIFEENDAALYFNRKRFINKSNTKSTEIIEIKNKFSKIKNDIDRLIDLDKSNSYSSFPERTLDMEKYSLNNILVTKKMNKRLELDGDINIDEFSIKMINNIQLDNYRHFASKTILPLSKVNLIVGENGTGKTSIIEAIEYGLTNTTQSDIVFGKKEENGKVILECTTYNEKKKNYFSGAKPDLYRKYLKLWYGITDSNVETLNKEFCKHNYFDIRGAFRFAFDDSKVMNISNEIRNFSEFLMDTDDLNICMVLDYYKVKINQVYEKTKAKIEEINKIIMKDTNNFNYIFSNILKRKKSNSFISDKDIDIDALLLINMISLKTVQKLFGKEQLSNIKKKLEKALEEFSKIIDDIQKFPSREELTKKIITDNLNIIDSFFRLLTSSKDYSGLKVINNRLVAIKLISKEEISFPQMSTGQKVCLALSIMFTLFLNKRNAPNIIFFDEPVANLDSFHLLNLMDVLREFALNNIQVVFTTTNPDIAKLFRRKFSFMEEDFCYYEIGKNSDGCVKITLKKFRSDCDSPVKCIEIAAE